MIGQTFGLLTVIERAPNARNGKSRWRCRCQCGGVTIAHGVDLRSGHSASCGCLQKQSVSQLTYKHGKKRTPEYSVWCNMKRRCLDPTNKRYFHYGARGIFVSPEWLHDFSKFLEDVGPRPSPLHQLDRIDNDGPYSKSNTRWSTPKEQSLNKQNTLKISLNGTIMPMDTVARQHNLNPATLYYRLKHNWPLEKALSTPPQPCRWRS